jgi:two-component system CheB/CheR fusion protein
MLRVLVVDDHPDTADGIAILLKMAGYDARTALNGHAALTLAAEFLPDAVILDLAMPKMSGYDLTRRLRHMFDSGLKIICYSGYAMDHDRQRARQAGCDHYVIKPSGIEEFLKLLGPAAWAE